VWVDARGQDFPEEGVPSFPSLNAPKRRAKPVLEHGARAPSACPPPSSLHFPEASWCVIVHPHSWVDAATPATTVIEFFSL